MLWLFSLAGLYIASQEKPLGQVPEQEITLCDLIEIQRTLAHSVNPFERLVGTLFAAEMLDTRLAQLTDREIDQLMLDHFGGDLRILQPEMTICQHATQRLFRSAGGKFTTEEYREATAGTRVPKLRERNVAPLRDR